MLTMSSPSFDNNMAAQRLFPVEGNDVGGEQPNGSSPSSYRPSPTEHQQMVHIDRIWKDFHSHVDIGMGDFGIVTKATYVHDNVTYAIKRSTKNIAGLQELHNRLQEVYAQACVTSDHIVRYYDSWMEGGVLYIMSEFMEGGSLGHCVVARGVVMPESELWQLLHQMALAVHAMHSSNIAHLDIKPDNIFFRDVEEESESTEGAERKRRVYKLGDFGLARPVFARSLGTSHRMYVGLNDDEGDRRYLCPAFIRDSTKFLCEADIYALGVSLYEVATSHTLSTTASREDILGYLRQGVVQELHHKYSPELLRVLRSMTLPDPTQRPTAFDLVIESYKGAFPGQALDGSGMSTGAAEVLATQEEFGHQLALVKEAWEAEDRAYRMGKSNSPTL